MDVAAMREFVDLCGFEDYMFTVTEGHGGIHLQARYIDLDIVSGKAEVQHTRKWLLSPAMTRSEIVQTCFKLVMTSMEHRARESFTYRGKRVFGPHFDVEALWQICTDRRFDVRPSEVTPLDPNAVRSLPSRADGATRQSIPTKSPPTTKLE